MQIHTMLILEIVTYINLHFTRGGLSAAQDIMPLASNKTATPAATRKDPSTKRHPQQAEVKQEPQAAKALRQPTSIVQQQKTNQKEVRVR